MQTRARSKEAREKRRRLLLDSALELFDRNGYAQTTVAQITSHAGLSTGTFYLYFKNKVALYRELYLESIRLLAQKFDDAVGADGHAVDRLRRLAKAYYDYYQTNRPHFRILAVLHINNEELTYSGRLDRLIDEQARALLERIEKILATGMRKGQVKDVDTWQTTTFFWAFMDGLILLEERNNMDFMGEDFDAVLGAGLKLIFSGIQVDSSHDSRTS